MDTFRLVASLGLPVVVVRGKWPRGSVPGVHSPEGEKSRPDVLPTAAKAKVKWKLTSRSSTAL